MTAVLRRLPVPVSEPYPSSGHPRPRPDVPPTQGALALAFSATDCGEDGDRWARPQPTPSAGLPEPRATCAVLVQAVVEVLTGTRQPSQLVRWLSADVYTALQRRAGLTARMRQPAPAPTAEPFRRPVVSSVRLCHPADGVVEASAVVLDGGRVRAVAVRLEGLDGRWRATALEVG
jgi:hypothetical protein